LAVQQYSRRGQTRRPTDGLQENLLIGKQLLLELKVLLPAINGVGDRGAGTYLTRLIEPRVLLVAARE
jgi:hypothetical protein